MTLISAHATQGFKLLKYKTFVTQFIKPTVLFASAFFMIHFFSKDLKIDLNDRIAFIKHLFNNENSEYQRVIRQIFTYSTLDEAKAFINEMVKPEYNNWLGKDTYEERFLSVIEIYFDPSN